MKKLFLLLLVLLLACIFVAPAMACEKCLTDKGASILAVNDSAAAGEVPGVFAHSTPGVIGAAVNFGGSIASYREWPTAMCAMNKNYTQHRLANLGSDGLHSAMDV